MNMKIVAIAVVAIVAVGGIAAAVVISNNNNNESGINIVDGSGKSIHLDSALTNVAVINKNIPRTLMMFGLESKISCYYWGTKSVPEFKTIEDVALNLGTYYTPSAEKLLEKKVQAVICPVSSMTPYASYQKAYEDIGIKVIRLDCNGSSLFDDMKKVSKIFGEPEKATKLITEYENNYKAIVDAINNKISADGSSKLDFMFAGAGSLYGVYNTSSAASSNLEQVFGKNITSYTDLSTKTVTNEFNTGTNEVIQSVQDKVQILIVRPGASDTTLTKYNTAYAKIVSNDGSTPLTQSATAVTNGKAYVMCSNMCSGLFMPLGLLALCETVYGDMEVKLTFDGEEKTYSGVTDYSTLLADFQDTYRQTTIGAGTVILAQYNSGSYSGNAVLSV